MYDFDVQTGSGFSPPSRPPGLVTPMSAPGMAGNPVTAAQLGSLSTPGVGAAAPQVGAGVGAGAGQPGFLSSMLWNYDQDGSRAGLNYDGLGLMSQGLSTLGGLASSFMQYRMAREQLDFEKDAYQTNLENQTQTYNTSLEDRIRSRYHTEGRSRGEADRYLDQHRL